MLAIIAGRTTATVGGRVNIKGDIHYTLGCSDAATGSICRRLRLEESLPQREP